MGLTAKEVGAYIRLLCFQWGHGSLPDNSSALNRIAGCEVSKNVLSKFTNGKNERLERERSKQLVWREKSRIGGLNSAAKRSTTLKPPLNHRGNQKPTIVTLQPKANIPSPSPISISLNTNTSEASPPHITPEQIYDSYPRKVGKQDALKAIKTILKLRSADDILARVKAYAGATMSYSPHDLQFVPYPATWFNRGSYDDDPETWKRNGTTKNQPISSRSFELGKDVDYSTLG